MHRQEIHRVSSEMEAELRPRGVVDHDKESELQTYREREATGAF
jgi:hypothetical protein